MKKVISVSLFLALSSALAFGSHIDQGSTDQGHTDGCTPQLVGDTGSPCVSFLSSGVGGNVLSTFNGSTTTIDDVFTFNVSSNPTGTVVFTPGAGFNLTSASYGLFLCTGGSNSSTTNYANMAIAGPSGIGTGQFAPCMALNDLSGIPETPADSGIFTYDLATLQADGLTNSTLAFIVKDGQGSFSLGSTSTAPEPSAVFLLLSGAIGVVATRTKFGRKQ